MIAILGIPFSFILILIMTNKYNLSAGMLVGSLTIAITSGLTLVEIGSNVLAALTGATTIELVLMITLVSMIANLMKETQLLENMINSLAELLNSKKLTMVAIPSIVGAMPIIGGALFSAPFVDPVADELEITNKKRAAINMVYRHAWFFIFPFIPGLILASRISDIEVFTLIRSQFVITLTIIIAGYLYFFGFSRQTEGESARDNGYILPLKTFVKSGLPILVSILLPLIFGINFVISLAAGFFLLVIMKIDEINFKLLKNSIRFNIIYAVIGIMIYREFVEYVPALNNLAEGIVDLGLSVTILAIILPVFVGLITGNIAATIGVSMPILLPMIGSDYFSHVLLIYGSSYFGYMFSPVHLCLVLTKEYWEINLNEVYRFFAVPMVAGWVALFALVFIF